MSLLFRTTNELLSTHFTIKVIMVLLDCNTYMQSSCSHQQLVKYTNVITQSQDFSLPPPPYLA